MPFELAQVVAELVEAVGFRGDLERGDDCFVDLPGGPAPQRYCRYAGEPPGAG